MVLVTGASGQVGMHLLQALSARGISARAWVHSERNEEAVLAAGAKEVFIGDLNAREAAAEAMQIFWQRPIRLGTATKVRPSSPCSATTTQTVFAEMRSP